MELCKVLTYKNDSSFMVNYSAIKSLLILNSNFEKLDPVKILQKFQGSNGGYKYSINEEEMASIVPTYLSLSLLSELEIN